MATTSKSALEQEFEEACLSDLPECRKLGYSPSYFLQMLTDYGAVETARRLINSDDVPEGFTRLWQMQRLDLTLEAGIYDNPKFYALFDEKTLAACKARLTRVGYIKDDKL
jgi:hypothetical protein